MFGLVQSYIDSPVVLYSLIFSTLSLVSLLALLGFVVLAKGAFDE